MLHIELENIVSESEAIEQIGALIAKVDGSENIAVITRNNHPAVALIAVNQLEILTGRSVKPALPIKPSSIESDAVSAPQPLPMGDDPVLKMETPPTPALPELPAMEVPEVVAPPLAFSQPAAPMAPALPELPELPDFPGMEEELSTPATPFAAAPMPQMQQAPFTPAPAIQPPMSAPIPTPPAQPVAPVMPPAPMPPVSTFNQPPVGMPSFAQRQETGLPPEDLSSSSPLA